MSYLIDTNVLSELRRRDPDANVVRWLNDRPATTLHLSVLTVGELRKGIESLLAATALARGLTLVTRNLRDFRYPNLQVLDPWAA